MHMLPCSAYFWHHICHMLSLDMFCNCHLFSFYIKYGNYAVSCLLASHNIREMCNAILFNHASYIWMISWPSFLHYISICRQCLYIKLLFMWIIHLVGRLKNLEWKQGLQSRQCYLSKQISCLSDFWFRQTPEVRTLGCVQRFRLLPTCTPPPR